MFGKKLKSAFSPQIASLSLNATIFALLLGLLSFSSSLWWVLAYIGYVIFLYVKHLQGAKTGAWFTYLFFVISSLVIARAVDITGFGVFMILVLGALLFLLLGSFTLRVGNPKIIGSTFYYFFIFTFVSLLLWSAPFPLSWWRMTLLFVFFWLTAREHIRFISGSYDKRKNVFIAVFAFLGMQVAWITSLSSIGFLNAASLTLVFMISALDIMLAFFSGALNKQMLKKETVFFLGFSLLILFVPLIT